MANNPGDSAEHLNLSLRRSVGSARSLTFAFADMSGKLGGAVNAAGQLAEGLAKVSRNARLVASATIIGAVVAAIGTVVAATIGWKEKTKEVADKMRDIRNETAILEAKAAGNKRAETELEIAGALATELDAAEKLESIFRKFPALQDAIRAKADAARRAAIAETKRAFDEQQFEARTATGLLYAGMKGERARRKAEAEAEQQREQDKAALNAEGFSPAEIMSRKQDIKDRYRAEIASIDDEVLTPIAMSLGQSFARSIADGISIGIQTGNFGAGFRALTGALLQGLGQMAIETGAAQLAFSIKQKLWKDSVALFAPEAGIAVALSMIALGAALTAAGSSMSGRGGGGGGGGYGGYGGTSLPQIVDRGLINPNNAPNTAGLQARPSVVFAPTIIGAHDAAAQSALVRMVKLGLARSGESL